MANVKKPGSRKQKNQNQQLPLVHRSEIREAEEPNNKTGDPQIQSSPAQEQKEKMSATWTSKDMIQTAVNILTGLGTIAAVFVVYFMTSKQNELSQSGIDLAERSYTIQ